MFNKPKIFIYIIFYVLATSPVYAGSLLDPIKKFFSFSISSDILESVNKNILGSLKAKEIRFYLPNKLEIKNIEVLDEYGEIVLSSPKITAVVSIISFLTNNITITDAQVYAPYFNYKINNSVHNITRLFESPAKNTKATKKSKIRISIDHVQVHDGRFFMKHDSGVEIIADGIKSRGKFWVESGPFGADISQADIREGIIKIAGMTLPITNLVSRNLFISHTKVSTPDLVAYYEKALVKANGTVYIDQENYDLSAFIKAPPNTYPQGLKPLPFAIPSFEAHVGLTGVLSSPQIALNMHTGIANFWGLIINQSHIIGSINEHEIIISSSDLNIDAAGKVRATGIINLDQEKFSFDTQQENINIPDIINSFDIKLNSSGSINAHTSLTGTYKPKNPVFNIKATGEINSGSVENINLGQRSNFEFDANYITNSKLIINHTQISDELGLKLDSTGVMNLLDNNYNLKYILFSREIKNYLSDLNNNNLKIRNIKSVGNINYKNKKINIFGTTSAKYIKFQEYNLEDFSGEFNLNNNNIILNNFQVKAYQGIVKGDVIIKDYAHEQKIDGVTILDAINLSEIPGTEKLSWQGILNANLALSGTLKKPQFKFDTKLSQGGINNLVMPYILASGSYNNNILNIEKLNAEGFLGSALGRDLLYDINSGNLGGSLYLNDFNIGGFLGNYSKDIGGFLSGPVYIDGTLLNPKITASLQAKNIKFLAHNLGSGSLFLALKRDLALNDLVFSIAALLDEAQSHSSWQAAIALKKKTINAHAVVSDLVFDTSKLGAGLNQIDARGLITGSLSVRGPLEDPSLSVELTSSEYTFFESQKRIAKTTIQKKHGPATLVALLKDGAFDLNLKASLGEQREGILLSIDGPCNFKNCELNMTGVFDYDHWEDLLPGLKNELATVSAYASINGKLIKNKDRQWEVHTKAQFKSFLASLPAIPRIELAEPISVYYAKDRLIFIDQAHFMFSPGDLTVSGSFSREALDLKLKGAIPLIFTRLVAPIVQRAEGLAGGDLRITGSLAEPVFDGYIAPEPGSEVTFNKYLESLEFKEGRINFKKNSLASFSTNLRNIKLALGDGRIFINGDFDKKNNIFDLQIEGSNIVVKNQQQFVESDFNLRTIKNSEDKTVLKGSIAVTDGLAYRQFDLRNFVARASSSSDNISSKFLENLALNIDLDVVIRQFRASARMLSIDIDTNLTGQFKAFGPIGQPKFEGSLVVSEGKITFPAQTFDLYESRIDLDQHADRGFHPKISIVTSQEFSQEEFGLQQDTTIQLSLTGDIDQLKLELKPVSGDMKLTQTRIFLMLLMPRTVPDEGGILRQSAQSAALAFSGEVFLRPFVNEIAELLEGKTKTRIQIGSALEPGGVTLRANWKIGPRIEVQGSYMYISDDYRRSERRTFITDSYPLLDLKLKLLLFDHKPLGPLFLESAVGANKINQDSYEPRGLLRLKYGILSK